jgi:hypothetical protein
LSSTLTSVTLITPAYFNPHNFPGANPKNPLSSVALTSARSIQTSFCNVISLVPFDGSLGNSCGVNF